MKDESPPLDPSSTTQEFTAFPGEPRLEDDGVVLELGERSALGGFAMEILPGSRHILRFTSNFEFPAHEALKPFLRAGVLARAFGIDNSPDKARETGPNSTGIDTSFNDMILFLDIETLGLGNALIILIGFAWLDRGTLSLEQYLLADGEGERDLINELYTRIVMLAPRVLVTFCGKQFDVPRIIQRATVEEQVTDQGRDMSGDIRSMLGGLLHIDIHEVFTTLFPGLPNHDFKSLEKHVLDIQDRQNDINGADVENRFNIFVHGADAVTRAKAALELVRHNAMDIVHLVFAFTAFLWRKLPSECQNPSESAEKLKKMTDVPDTWPQNLETPAITPLPVSPISRINPAMIIHARQASSWGTTDENLSLFSRVASLFDSWTSIDQIKSTVLARDAGLASTLDRHGWFFSLEQACLAGLLERNDGAEGPSYRRRMDEGGLATIAYGDPAPASLHWLYMQEPCGNEDLDQPEDEVDVKIALGTDVPSPVSDVPTCPPSNPDPVPASTWLAGPKDAAPAPAQTSPATPKNDGLPTQLRFSIEDTLAGWILACGSVAVQDAADTLGIDPVTVRLVLFGLVGSGRIAATFTNNVFFLQRSRGGTLTATARAMASTNAADPSDRRGKGRPRKQQVEPQ